MRAPEQMAAFVTKDNFEILIQFIFLKLVASGLFKIWANFWDLYNKPQWIQKFREVVFVLTSKKKLILACLIIMLIFSVYNNSVILSKQMVPGLELGVQGPKSTTLTYIPHSLLKFKIRIEKVLA